jgi:hypothetical protein
MQPNSFGKISVPTPGTPVQVTADSTIRANRIRFQNVIGEAGHTFLGVSGMNKSTYAGVIKDFWPTGGGGGVADSYEIVSADGSNDLVPSQYFVDANSASEGLIVAYWTR